MRLSILGRLGGFSLIGLANTVLSMALLFVLNEFCHVDYRVSYAVSYVLTILLAYVANARLVFGAAPSIKGAMGFLSAYLSGMVFGMVLLWFAMQLFPSANATLLSYSVIPFTLGWNFFFVNKLFKAGKGKGC